jgi:hypothetical protein
MVSLQRGRARVIAYWIVAYLMGTNDVDVESRLLDEMRRDGMSSKSHTLLGGDEK